MMMLKHSWNDCVSDACLLLLRLAQEALYGLSGDLSTSSARIQPLVYGACFRDALPEGL